MPSVRLSDLEPLELIAGVSARIASSENIMLSHVEFDEGCQVPEHRHPNEQCGIVISGRIRFTIAGEEHVVEAGDFFMIPPNEIHSAVAIEGPAVALDIFVPPRSDYLERRNQAFGG
ncbi:MAG: cupin domain-containing protein [Chloroflexota bacterium]|nr:cupin domain-containing protein [Chloroflexota bacterium]